MKTVVIPVYNTQGLFTYQLCMYESAELAGERDTPRAVVYTTLHRIKYVQSLEYVGVFESSSGGIWRIPTTVLWVQKELT